MPLAAYPASEVYATKRFATKSWLLVAYLLSAPAVGSERLGNLLTRIDLRRGCCDGNRADPGGPPTPSSNHTSSSSWPTAGSNRGPVDIGVGPSNTTASKRGAWSTRSCWDGWVQLQTVFDSGWETAEKYFGEALAVAPTTSRAW